MNKKQRKAIAKVDALEASARDASFEEWFVAQYGPRPSHKLLIELIGDAQEKETIASAARYRVQCVQRWNDERDAALKAWSAARTQK
jgi:hypothetical protein